MRSQFELVDRNGTALELPLAAAPEAYRLARDDCWGCQDFVTRDRLLNPAEGLLEGDVLRVRITLARTEAFRLNLACNNLVGRTLASSASAAAWPSWSSRRSSGFIFVLALFLV